MSCDVGCRRSLDPGLLWPWRRPAATAPIGPLAWEPLYAEGAAQEMAKRKKDKKKKRKKRNHYTLFLGVVNSSVWVLKYLKIKW